MIELDPRALRSRAALIDAMIEALDAGASPAEISITEIVKRAEVSRPTFYQHFGAMPALVRAAAFERLDAAFALVPAPAHGVAWADFSEASMVILLGHLNEHAGFYLAVLHEAGLAPISNIVDLLATRFLEVAPFSPAIRADADAARERAEFLAAGITWSVVRWLDEGGGDLAGTARRFSQILVSSVPAHRAD